MIPDWIPNIHPLVVHFPIALLVIAVFFDAARLFFKKESWLQKATLALYTTGSVGLIAAFWSGRRAVETVSVTGDAIPVVTSHEDWALYTLIYFLVFTTIRNNPTNVEGLLPTSIQYHFRCAVHVLQTSPSLFQFVHSSYYS